MGAVLAAAGAAFPTLSLEHADDAAYDEEKGDGEDEDDDEGLHTADCWSANFANYANCFWGLGCRRIGRIWRINFEVGLSADWVDCFRLIRSIRRRKEERIRRQRSREPSWKTSVETTQARPMV